jgi:hypothetical protein
LLLGDPITARLLVALTAVCLGIALVNRAPPTHPGVVPAAAPRR